MISACARQARSTCRCMRLNELLRISVSVLGCSMFPDSRYTDFAWRAQADIIIEPDVKQFVWDDFTRTPDMVAAGEVAALQALPQIRAALRGEKRDSAPGGNLSTAILK